MEIVAIILGVLFEKARPDLLVRRLLRPLPRIGGRHRAPAAVALAGVDLRRLLLRPSTVLVLYVLYRVFAPPLPTGKPYDGVNRLIGFSLAFVGLAVLAVVASIGGRDRGSELVAATPTAERGPVLSWVALLGGLALLEYGALALLRFGREEPSYGHLLPDAWELTQGPIMLLGGGLLGLLLARLLPAWVAAPVGVVLGVAWVGVLSGTFERTTMLAPVVEWIQWHEDGRVVVEPGSFAWHNAYLLGLCALGVVALLLTVSRRRGPLAAVGALLALGTVLVGTLAVP